MDDNGIGTVLVAAATEVHRVLGPGLFESVYEEALVQELTAQGVRVERQVSVPATYKGRDLGCSFRADLIVEGRVIAELKSIEYVLPVHKKQLLTYLRLTGLSLGYLLNFGAPLMKDGISRCVNGLKETVPPTAVPNAPASPCVPASPNAPASPCVPASPNAPALPCVPAFPCVPACSSSLSSPEHLSSVTRSPANE